MEQLQRILALEAARGFDDRAVIGGLDRFLRGQSPPHAGSRLARALAALPPGGYASLSQAERRRWAAALADRELPPAEGRRPPSPAPTPAPRPEGLRRAAPARLGHPTKPSISWGPRLAPEAPVAALGGVGKGLQARLARLGVRTVADLLYLFPRRYNDYSAISPIAGLRFGEEQTVVGTLWSIQEARLGRFHRGVEAVVGDETGNIRAVWFNQTHIARQLRRGQRVALSGRVVLFKGQRVMEGPEYEPLGQGQPLHTARLVPVYPLTEGLSPKSLRRLTMAALEAGADALPEPLPPELRRRLALPPLARALRQIHFPDSLPEAEEARRRLALEELLTVQIGVLGRRRRWQQGQAPALALPPEALQGFRASLPFPFTQAQERALAEILADLGREQPMSRLLQGEVGSGKTVVAAAALLAAVASGYQGALMAPTEVLAEQHYRTLSAIFGGDGLGWLELPYLGRPLRVALLIGGLPERAKEQVRQALLQGQVDVAVGTHALIQEEVLLPRLALAVVDEQHRFGVVQRAALRQKGPNGAPAATASRPHLLVMTATPIPRTLTLTLYGDLDLSVLDEMPPGRRPIKTTMASPQERQEAYEFLRDEVRKGRQGYVICPLVEESEQPGAPRPDTSGRGVSQVGARAAVQEFRRLQGEVFPELRLGLLHGRMASREKDRVMRLFQEGALDILVSTAVVEVGIDVPNATVMLVEGADRFGLAQLHQFRGRVGRGPHPSYCLLLAEDPSPEAQERLRLLEETQDGFRLAEEDLRLRGPGQYLGTRQSGLPDLKVARLSDLELMEVARREAARLLDEDPDLSQAPLLAQRAAPLWELSAFPEAG